jgi:hypothetical protein
MPQLQVSQNYSFYTYNRLHIFRSYAKYNSACGLYDCRATTITIVFSLHTITAHRNPVTHYHGHGCHEVTCPKCKCSFCYICRAEWGVLFAKCNHGHVMCSNTDIKTHLQQRGGQHDENREATTSNVVYDSR